MRNLLITLVVTLLSLNLVAQSEGKNLTEHQNDSIFSESLADSSLWKTVKVFYNERPMINKPKKQPVYHEFKVIGGIIFASFGTTDFSNMEKPFTFGQNLLPNICIITNSTYHNLVYGLANNTIKVVNGFPFGQHGLDVYLVPGINLNSGVVCITTGIEKKIEASDGVNFFLFTEFGKDIKSGSKFTLSIGFHVNIQGTLIQHKGGEIFPQ